MFKMTLKTKIAILMTVFNVFLILGTVVVLYYLLNGLLYRELQIDLKHEANEIITQYLKVDGGRIVYQKDDQGQSISTHLLNDGSSALIINSNNELLGAFGVYRLNQNIGNTLQSTQLKSALGNKSEVYSNTNQLFESKDYAVLSVPITTDNITYGAVQVAKENNLITKISAQSANILLVIVPWAILISLILVHFILKYSFKGLENLISKMQEISTNNLNVQVIVKGHPDDETVRLGKTFNQMIKRVDSGVNIQKQFISDASHELMTPLTRSLSSLDIAQDSLESKDLAGVRTEISYAKSDIKELGELTQSLLLLSKLESEPAITTQIFSPYILVADIIGKYQPLISEKDIETSLEINQNIKIRFSKKFFEVLLSNLISNAVKYNKPQGKILIKGVESKNGKVFHIKVIDTGKGMSQETVNHIFDRFYRGEDTSPISGFGIGMALVKRIADISNTKIKIESKLGDGTTLTLDLPI